MTIRGHTGRSRHCRRASAPHRPPLGPRRPSTSRSGPGLPSQRRRTEARATLPKHRRASQRTLHHRTHETSHQQRLLVIHRRCGLRQRWRSITRRRDSLCTSTRSSTYHVSIETYNYHMVFLAMDAWKWAQEKLTSDRLRQIHTILTRTKFCSILLNWFVGLKFTLPTTSWLNFRYLTLKSQASLFQLVGQF